MKSRDFQDKLTHVKVDPWTKDLNQFNEFLKQDRVLWEKDAQRSGLIGTL